MHVDVVHFFNSTENNVSSVSENSSLEKTTTVTGASIQRKYVSAYDGAALTTAQVKQLI